MPLFIDIHHKVEGLSTEAITAAHQQDLAVQARFGVRFIRYWYDERRGSLLPVRSARREAITAAHRAAHGLVADESSRFAKEPRRS